MLTRTALALLLLLPAAASAQDLDTALSALVRISGTRGDTPVRGSGFVVGLDRDKATIVTASHVIEGVQQLEVTFAADLAEVFSAGSVLGLDAGSPHGLAVFQVRGALPSAVTTLSFEVEKRPRLGDALFLLGFPQMAPAPRMTQRILSARSGTLLLVDQDIGEGFSGGPVLQGGKVVGVITDTDDQTTYAVNALVVREALEGWEVKLGAQRSTPVSNATKPAPQVVEKCLPGKVRTENGIDFVRICAGTFMMGSTDDDLQADANEKPAHEVTLSEFWIGKTEITGQQYKGFRQSHPGAADLPATSISWFDAKAACEHFGGRLPTEAEWEYAARAGGRTVWSAGVDRSSLPTYEWYGLYGAGNDPSASAPLPVGSKKANVWGLHDMLGNVREWVADLYGTYSAKRQINPAGPRAGEYRVVRGGSFLIWASDLRSASRSRFKPEYRDRFIGFRCVIEPSGN